MMIACLVCGAWRGHPVCARCLGSMTPGPSVRLSSGLALDAALRHTGAARVLVHRLKYDGMAEAAAVLAVIMATRVPDDVVALVPVPRATLRRLRYGIDPAMVLARALSRLTGVPALAALAPTPWWPRHAGAERRAMPRFRATRRIEGPVLLVDDVATTGVTLTAAAATLGVTFGHGLTATSPIRMQDEAVEAPAGAGEVA